MQLMGMQKELHPNDVGDHIEVPHANHTFTKREQKMVCKLVKAVKMPDGQASNISHRASVEHRTIKGLKVTIVM